MIQDKNQMRHFKTMSHLIFCCKTDDYPELRADIKIYPHGNSITQLSAFFFSDTCPLFQVI